MLDTKIEEQNADFLDDVLIGLGKPAKSLPCKWFYDAAGSALFEDITKLPEYYPTRTEIALLNDIMPDLATQIGPQARIVEYGAGALRKTRILLDGLEHPAAYLPIDVSDEFLRDAAQDLATDYPGLDVSPIVDTFLNPELQVPLPSGDGTVLGFFPGSTIGNLSDADIQLFLKTAQRTLGPDGRFLIGVDINQDPATLLPAYNDAAGVTADFNLNLLQRINTELSANFKLGQFTHDARWNADDHRIEMYLVSDAKQNVSIAGTTISFEEDETIHTENSRKFTLTQLEGLAVKAGWRIAKHWSAPGDTFAVLLLDQSDIAANDGA